MYNTKYTISILIFITASMAACNNRQRDCEPKKDSTLIAPSKVYVANEGFVHIYLIQISPSYAYDLESSSIPLATFDVWYYSGNEWNSTKVSLKKGHDIRLKIKDSVDIYTSKELVLSNYIANTSRDIIFAELDICGDEKVYLDLLSEQEARNIIGKYIDR